MACKVHIEVRDFAARGEIETPQYSITVVYEESGNFLHWEIMRSISDFAKFRENVLSLGTLTKSCPFLVDCLPEDAQGLQVSVNDYLTSHTDGVWKNQEVVKFLDSCNEQSIIANIQIGSLTREVQKLSTELSEQAQAMHSLQASHNVLYGMVQSLLANNESGLTKKTSAGNMTIKRSGDLLKSLFPPVLPSAGGNTESSGDTTEDQEVASNNSSFRSMNTTDLNSASGAEPLRRFSTDAVEGGAYPPDSAQDSADNTEGNTSRTFRSERVLQPPTPLPTSTSPRRSFRADALAPLKIEESSSRSASSSAPCTPHFPVDLHPCEAMCTYYSASIEQIVDAVRPSNAQMAYRHSVITMLRKQVRLSLNANAFPSGLHDILCSLPDDPISISPIISKAQLSSWHICLSDRLNLLNDRLATSGNVELVYPDEEELLLNLPEDYHHALRHEISNVSHSKLNMNFCVHLNVDTSTEVELLANSRHEICMLAFLQEVASLVGQNELFKRSLLLIRAWWFYETAAYVGTPIKHYLKEIDLCIMVCAVFNQYHARISSPLQALCLFLAEYSAYDGATHAITLQGIVPFKSPTSSQPMLLDAQPTHLISCEVIERHWNLFNLSAATIDACEYEQFLRSSSSDDVHNDDPDGVMTGGAASMLAGLRPEHDVQLRSAPGGIEKVNMKSLSNHNLHYFERQLFNIVNPFNHTNMLVEKLSSRRQMRLHKAFEIGAVDLTVYLRQSINNANNSGDILHFFPNLLARFSDTFSATRAGESQASTTPVEEKYFSNAEKLLTTIMYCNMMLESALSEPALLTLSTEILAVKGPLPVGEIGKLLAETTSIGNMSQKLKEKFGGLKKFLERFQNVFVISNDHPFNPNVLLRCSLSAEHLDLIDRGIFPHQLLLKPKKPTTPSTKKKKSNSITGSMLGPDYNLPQNQNSAPHPGGGMVHVNSTPHSAHQVHKMIGGASLSINTGHGSSGSSPSNAAGNHSQSQGTPKYPVKAPMGSSPGSSHKGGGKHFSNAAQYPVSSPHSLQHGQSHGQFTHGMHGSSSQQQHMQHPGQSAQNQGQNQGQGMQNVGFHQSPYPAPRSTPPPPPSMMSPHLTYAQQANTGVYAPPQSHALSHSASHQQMNPGQMNASGGYLSHTNSVSSMSNASTNTAGGGNPFNRSFREADLNELTGYGLDPNTYRNQGAQHSAQRSSSLGAGSVGGGGTGGGGGGGGGNSQNNYYDDILSGPNALDPTGGFPGQRLSIGSTSNHLLSNLRLGSQDLQPTSPPEDNSRQRLHSTGSLYGHMDPAHSGGQDLHPGAYQPYPQFRTPMSPPMGQQQAHSLSPNHILYGGGASGQLTQAQAQQLTQQYAQQQQYGTYNPPDDGNKSISGHNNDSFLRDFSKF